MGKAYRYKLHRRANELRSMWDSMGGGQRITLPATGGICGYVVKIYLSWMF